MKPLEHAQNNVKKYGGKVEDYLPIHEFLDSSKQGLGDKRHRAIFHNSFGIYNVLPRIFGSIFVNSDDKTVSVTQIGEDHVLEDFDGKFIPTLSDFLSEICMQPWMDNGNGYPPSFKPLTEQKIERQSFRDIQIDGKPNKYGYKKIELSSEDIDRMYEEAKRDNSLFFTSPSSD